MKNGDESGKQKPKKDASPDGYGTEQPEKSAKTPVSSGRRYGRRMGDMGGGESRPVIWMITFTDVMGLMLTFFVMLFSMSEPAKDQWDEISSALHNELNRLYGATFSRGPTDELNLSRIDYDRALDINYLTALMETVLKDNETLKSARLIRQPGKLIISMPQELLFQPGEASVTEDGARALYLLGGALSRIKNKIQIAGYADPRPVQQGQDTKYNSNWDLSLARAAGVAGLLNSVGYGQNIDLIGYGSGRYDDLSAIPDEKQRLDLSRRVDIVLLNHDGRKRELPFDLTAP